jgi:membrane protein implicated in regulation of membrane protease activity
MTQVQLAKMVLAVAGIVAFLFGIRTGLDGLRWTGIVLVTAAFLMRFVGRAGSRSHSPTAQTEDRT